MSDWLDKYMESALGLKQQQLDPIQLVKETTKLQLVKGDTPLGIDMHENSCQRCATGAPCTTRDILDKATQSFFA